MSTTPLPGDGPEVPTEESAIQVLTELLGGTLAAAVWAAAVDGAGLQRPVTRLDDLERVADQLAQIGSKVGRVGARSLKIRLLSYQAMATTVDE